MPKRKTGQRKKAEKQKERQQGIRQAYLERPLAERPCNASMVRMATSQLDTRLTHHTVISSHGQLVTGQLVTCPFFSHSQLVTSE